MIVIHAMPRSYSGTSNSRYVRKVNHKIPGIIYGKKFLHKELLILIEHDIIFHLQKKNVLKNMKVLINLKDKEFLVLVKEIQYHAFKPIILHMDFLCIQ